MASGFTHLVTRSLTNCFYLFFKKTFVPNIRYELYITLIPHNDMNLVLANCYQQN